MSFDRLGLSPDLLRAVAAQGYAEPTPVQAEAIPIVLAGRDLLAGAQTGTGKTAAFVLPMLQRLATTLARGPAFPPGAAPARGPVTPARGAGNGRGPIRTLILTPTRELCLQVEESVRTYSSQRPVRSVPIYGGVGFDPQVRALRSGAAVVVATPGRLLDHVTQRTIDLSTVEILVLDEADRMLDMGFIRDIRKILALLPAERQNLLFSATFSAEIRQLADGLLRDPAFVQVTPKNTTADLVRQVIHPVDRERKRELLSHLIRTGRIDQALVFTRTKHGANRLSQQLERDGISSAAIHGNKSQSQRVRALSDLKNGRVDILVATDVAARGLDIEALPHVVNYELPTVAEDYIHRIGRTGRAGVDGDAVSLVCVDEGPLLRGIEKLLGRGIPAETISGFEPDRSIPAEPIKFRSGMAGHQGAPGGQRPGGGQRSFGGQRPAGRGAGSPARGGSPSRGGSPARGGGFGQAGPAARRGGHPTAQRNAPSGMGIGSQRVALPGERLARQGR